MKGRDSKEHRLDHLKVHKNPKLKDSCKSQASDSFWKRECTVLHMGYTRIQSLFKNIMNYTVSNIITRIVVFFFHQYFVNMAPYTDVK